MSAITHLLKPHSKDLGGFEVRRLLPALTVRSVGPFIFFDHLGPARFSPKHALDVRPHPHIGLATLTYLFEGEILHRDSLGSVQTIRPGDVNWMTAGKGIVHSERTPAERRAEGMDLHGLQMWLALPTAEQECAPDFAHYPAAQIPEERRAGALLRVIVGTAFGHTSPVKSASNTLFVAIELQAQAQLIIPAQHAERALYLLGGTVQIDNEAIAQHHLAVLQEGQSVTITANSPAKLMLIGGEPLDGPRFIWWNFVSHSKDRIEQAKQDWQSGRFGTVPGETDFIPLPER